MRKLHTLISPFARPLVLFIGSLLFCSIASAQDTAASLPDAPAEAQQQPAAQAPGAAPVHEDPQQKRIFGIMPNFRAVTAGTHLPPQSVKDKLFTASEDSFDYSSFILAGMVATEAFVAKDTPEFHQDATGFGRYYWHTFVDQTSENYFVEFIVPAIVHEDTRFYSLGQGGFGKRFGYAITRTFVTRTDSGKATFNSGEIVGAGISSIISNFYYPRPERGVGNTLDKYGVNVGIDMASFVVKEFYPDIYHILFHRRIEPQTTP